MVTNVLAMPVIGSSHHVSGVLYARNKTCRKGCTEVFAPFSRGDEIILKRLSSALAVCLRREVRDVGCQTECDGDTFNDMNGQYTSMASCNGMVRTSVLCLRVQKAKCNLVYRRTHDFFV